MMRMRMVHPGFWKDKTLRGCAATTLLTYIGLWQLADDAGWLEWDAEVIGLELFPWHPIAEREEFIALAETELTARGRIRNLGCGHAQIPKMPEYQRAGRPTHRVRDEHLAMCQRKIPANPAISAEMAASEPTESNVEESSVKDSNNHMRAREEIVRSADWSAKVIAMKERGNGVR